MNGLDGSGNIVVPGLGDSFNELLFVGFEHCVGLSELIESHLHDCLNLIWMNGEVEVHWDIWKSVLEHWKLVKSIHRDDIVCMWVVVGNHVLLKLRNDVSEPNTIDIHVHGDVCADVVHGANINLLLPEDQVFPDVEVLVNNELLVLLPSKEKGVEIGIAGGVFSLNIIPPSPYIMVIPLE